MNSHPARNVTPIAKATSCEGHQKFPDDYKARLNLLSNRAVVMHIHAPHSNWRKIPLC
jgi:hypothetical protein